jgi:hypothetical protein
MKNITPKNTTKIKISELKEKIILFESIVSSDNFGDQSKKIKKICETWAKISPASKSSFVPKFLQLSHHFKIINTYKIIVKESEILKLQSTYIEVIQWGEKYIYVSNGPILNDNFLIFTAVEIQNAPDIHQNIVRDDDNWLDQPD